MTRRVLVFDSGFGGFSVVREIVAQVLGVEIVYIADDAAFPFGDWEEEALRTHIVDLLGDFIARHRPDAVVIACNTASTLVLADLRVRHAIPFVGTVPAIKMAAERTKTGLFSVLATPVTVRRDYTFDLIAEFAPAAKVTLVGASHLAALAEDRLSGRPVDMARLKAEIAPCFAEREGARTDIVVLACTHYPFLADLMAEVAPWPVTFLNPAGAIARQVGVVLGASEDKGAVEPAARPIAEIVFTSGRQAPADITGIVDRAFAMSTR
ncbi:glutamate racemase [Rhodobium gokarnense]|uniref:Glutamate racemase n=1 Tax=Rhodobium gokarnense TaxID=364296 RepID=A0ABT3HD74_9HYPH|nr:glutamate racemase [Rhodobium gokarnense]MCW2308355.1 glutamate racemase [Rhodobium gokarnense]